VLVETSPAPYKNLVRQSGAILAAAAPSLTSPLPAILARAGALRTIPGLQPQLPAS
jgi:hypothetical protein